MRNPDSVGKTLNIQLVGDENLIALFKDFTPKIQDKIVQAGYKKASQLILNQAKINFIGIKKNKSLDNYKMFFKAFQAKPLRYQVGSKLGLLQYGHGYKGLFIERGTEKRWYTKGLKRSQQRKLMNKDGIFYNYVNSGGKTSSTHYVGKIESKPFFYPAVDQKKNEAMSMVNDYILQALEKMAKKYGVK